MIPRLVAMSHGDSAAHSLDWLVALAIIAVTLIILIIILRMRRRNVAYDRLMLLDRGELEVEAGLSRKQRKVLTAHELQDQYMLACKRQLENCASARFGSSCPVCLIDYNLSGAKKEPRRRRKLTCGCSICARCLDDMRVHGDAACRMCREPLETLEDATRRVPPRELANVISWADEKHQRRPVQRESAFRVQRHAQRWRHRGFLSDSVYSTWLASGFVLADGLALLEKAHESLVTDGPATSLFGTHHISRARMGRRERKMRAASGASKHEWRVHERKSKRRPSLGRGGGSQYALLPSE